MCIATPVKILKVRGSRATVDALGEDLEIDTSLLKNVSTGEYLLVKGELAIQKLTPGEAEEILELVKKCAHHH
jgi:hydrogenase assembly chaperone HypC/HupF